MGIRKACLCGSGHHGGRHKDGAGRGRPVGRFTAQLVFMFLFQVVQGVQGMDNLHRCDPCSPQPLEQVNLLDGKARLLTLLEHPRRQNKDIIRPVRMQQAFTVIISAVNMTCSISYESQT